jgi:hypothetical protein
MEKSTQIAWKIVPLRDFFALKVVPLIEVLLYAVLDTGSPLCVHVGFLGTSGDVAIMNAC